ncbi:50S ribosomal protein L18 [Rickettsiales bacterium LUAb2]
MKDSSLKLFNQRKQRNRFAVKNNNKSKKPRLSVFKSGNHIYAQIIDDISSVTLVAASTLNKEIAAVLKNKTNNVKSAQLVGKLIAEQAIKANIKEVVFDRGGYVFHGKIKALADSAKEHGLKI